MKNTKYYKLVNGKYQINMLEFNSVVIYQVFCSDMAQGLTNGHTVRLEPTHEGLLV